MSSTPSLATPLVFSPTPFRPPGHPSWERLGARGEAGEENGIPDRYADSVCALCNLCVYRLDVYTHLDLYILKKMTVLYFKVPYYTFLIFVFSAKMSWV